MQSLRRHPARRALAARPLRVCGPLLACPRCGLVLLSPRLTAGGVRRLLRDRLSPARQRLPRPLDRRRDGAGGATTLRRRARRVPAALAACAPEQRARRRRLDRGRRRRRQGRIRSRARPYSIPRPTSSPMLPLPGWRPLPGSPRTPKSAARTFDLVLLCQTIDHLLDIAATLHSIRSWVAPGGLAFVDVLDVEFMLLRRGAIEGADQDRPSVFPHARRPRSPTFAQAGLSPTAERLSDDGHLGFLLEPVEPAEPVWAELAEAERAQAPGLAVARARMRAVAVFPPAAGPGAFPVRTWRDARRAAPWCAARSRPRSRRADSTASLSPSDSTRSSPRQRGSRSLAATAGRARDRRPRGRSTSSFTRSPSSSGKSGSTPSRSSRRPHRSQLPRISPEHARCSSGAGGLGGLGRAARGGAATR